MSWGMVAGAAITVIGGAMSENSQKKADKQQNKWNREAQILEHQQNLELEMFKSDLDYRDKQRERAGRQRGLDEFRKFSTIQQFAPEYEDTSKRIEVPEVVLPGTQTPTAVKPVTTTPKIVTPVSTGGNTPPTGA